MLGDNNRLNVVNLFSKIGKNIKTSWRLALRKNSVTNLEYTRLSERATFLEIFNLSRSDYIAVVYLGVLSSPSDNELVLKALSEHGNLTITHFKACPQLPEQASQRLNSLFSSEYALLTAFPPFLVVSTNSESSWLAVVRYVLSREVEQSLSSTPTGISLLLVRDRNLLIDMRDNQNSAKFRTLFKNFSERRQLYLLILRMLGAKLTKSFDWVSRFF